MIALPRSLPFHSLKQILTWHIQKRKSGKMISGYLMSRNGETIFLYTNKSSWPKWTHSSFRTFSKSALPVFDVELSMYSACCLGQILGDCSTAGLCLLLCHSRNNFNSLDHLWNHLQLSKEQHVTNLFLLLCHVLTRIFYHSLKFNSLFGNNSNIYFLRVISFQV